MRMFSIIPKASASLIGSGAAWSLAVADEEDRIR